MTQVYCNHCLLEIDSKKILTNLEMYSNFYASRTHKLFFNGKGIIRYQIWDIGHVNCAFNKHYYDSESTLVNLQSRKNQPCSNFSIFKENNRMLSTESHRMLSSTG